MLFVMLVAMALALFTTGWRLHRCETELDEFRREYGILKVDDPTKLSAVACWTPEPGRWRWKVHFPPGKYDIHCALSGIPESGLPGPEWKGGLCGGPGDRDADVEVTVYKAAKSGKWQCSIADGGTTMFVDVPPSLMNAGQWQTGGVVWKGPPAVVSPEEPIVLLRRRMGIAEKDGSYRVTLPDLCDGLMIWIQRADNVPNKSGGR
jgi:hypothetical protein